MFLLANNVSQPQYDLWLVPFFALLAVPWKNIVWYLAADAAIFVFHIARNGTTMPAFACADAGGCNDWFIDPINPGHAVARLVHTPSTALSSTTETATWRFTFTLRGPDATLIPISGTCE